MVLWKVNSPAMIRGNWSLVSWPFVSLNLSRRFHRALRKADAVISAVHSHRGKIARLKLTLFEREMVDQTEIPSKNAPGRILPDKIVVLSDGTGNSSAKVWRTNVLRTFEFLDLTGSDQVAMYDDGVGTSFFLPLALLGGAFGWGLKRNVIDLYKFICRNYRRSWGKSRHDMGIAERPLMTHLYHWPPRFSATHNKVSNVKCGVV
jgi:Uncharacterized alpha/beta hydrolase domain (DUF2235)